MRMGMEITQFMRNDMAANEIIHFRCVYALTNSPGASSGADVHN